MSSTQQLLLGEGAGGSGPAVYIEDVFSTYLYTGTGSAQTITNGIDFSTKGGLLWLKARNDTRNNWLYDTTRSIANGLRSDSTAAATSTPSALTSFNNNGFSIGTSGNINTSNNKLVSWSFRKQPKFFTCGTYTGNGASNRVITHDLGSTPGCIIVKNMTYTGASWNVYHRSLSANEVIYLNLTNAAGGTTGIRSVTSTSFTLGATDEEQNFNGHQYVYYAFAHNAGGFGPTGTDNVITCGSFTSATINGNVSGLVTDLGYEPQLVLYKKTSGVQDWYLVDSIRGFSQRENNELSPNTTAIETNAAGGNSQFPSPTGFQLNVGGSVGDTYIYIAIRRGPMKVPTVGTSVFMPLVTAADDAAIGTTNFPIDLQIGGNRASNDTTNNWNMFTRRIQLSTVTDNSGAGLRTSSDAAENTGLTFPYNYNNTGYQNYGSRTWSLNFVRAPQFFEVVCYTGTAANRTITHNLAAVPELIITKTRALTGGGSGANWAVYHSAVGNTKVLYLNGNNAASTASANWWNNTTPTSSVFTVGIADAVNASATALVAYLFASCPGVSKVGSYTGTGTTKQIDCGFTGGARFVLIKRTDSTGDWYVWDTARGIVSGNDPYLLLNSTAAEVTNTDYIDTYSAGFEISSTAPAAINASGGTFIFLAIA